MVALVVSFLLIAYLLVPRAIFRLAGIFVPLRFQRSRAEEVTFACWISLLPLTLALLLLVLVSGGPSAIAWQRTGEMFAGGYSESIFANAQTRFFAAAWDVFLKQIGFLVLFYYPLVILESVLFIVLVRKYGDWRHKCFYYAWFVEQILLQGVNEWYVLLTDFTLSKARPRKVSVDVLTQEDHLYRGDIAQYFIDHDGALSGIFLENPFRFDRRGYLLKKDKESAAKPDDYWKEILGDTLYVPSVKILSLNIRYPTLEAAAEKAEMATKALSPTGLRVVLPVASEIATKAVGLEARVEVRIPSSGKPRATEPKKD